MSVLSVRDFADVGVEGDDEAIPLPNVDSATLEKVLEWCTEHADDPEPFVDDFEDEFETTQNVIITPWDRKFYDVEHEIIFDILLAANYLDIKLCEFRLSAVALVIEEGWLRFWNLHLHFDST